MLLSHVIIHCYIWAVAGMELPRFDGHLSAWDLPRAFMVDFLWFLS